MTMARWCHVATANCHDIATTSLPYCCPIAAPLPPHCRHIAATPPPQLLPHGRCRHIAATLVATAATRPYCSDVVPMSQQFAAAMWRQRGIVAMSYSHVVVTTFSRRPHVATMWSTLRRHVLITSLPCCHHILAMWSPCRRIGVVALLRCSLTEAI